MRETWGQKPFCGEGRHEGECRLKRKKETESKRETAGDVVGPSSPREPGLCWGSSRTPQLPHRGGGGGHAG